MRVVDAIVHDGRRDILACVAECPGLFDVQIEPCFAASLSDVFLEAVFNFVSYGLESPCLGVLPDTIESESRDRSVVRTLERLSSVHRMNDSRAWPACVEFDGSLV